MHSAQHIGHANVGEPAGGVIHDLPAPSEGQNRSTKRLQFQFNELSITDGATKEEAVRSISEAGGIPTLLVVAFDRMERAVESRESTSQIFAKSFGFPVIAASSVMDLIEVLRDRENEQMLNRVEEYRRQYGVA